MTNDDHASALNPQTLILCFIAINACNRVVSSITSPQQETDTSLPPVSLATSNSTSDELIKSFNRSTTPFSRVVSGFSPDTGYHHIQQASEKLQDTITWSPDTDRLSQEWRIFAPESSGFVVEFSFVEMKGHDFLEIFVNERNSSVLWRNFTKVVTGTLSPLRPHLSVAPLLMSGEELVIRMHACKNKGFSDKSNFSLSYAAVNQSFPRPVRVQDEQPTESDVIYNCSGIVHLPSAISCDGIRHCQVGEDEVNCSYAQPGCGDWVPYNDQCLKVKFVRNLTFKPGHSHVTTPLRAEHSCQSQYNATLALLPDHLGIQIVSDLIRQSGFQNAVVGIKKVKPDSRRVRHLYRYLWQWGERGSPVAYEQQALQRSGTSFDCAVLVVSPRPYLQPVECVLPNPVPQGYVCMRPNPARSERKVRLSGVSFPKAASAPDQFPHKECHDGSVVQTFHRCQWGETEEDSDVGWSSAGLPSFQCHSGDTIHYSLLCDGKDDCDDRTDERYCKHPQFSPLQESSFICRNAQAVPSDKRCNGVMDCFDESDEESCVSCGTQIMCLGAGCVPIQYGQYFDTCPQLPVFGEEPLVSFKPAIISMDGYGMSRLKPLTEDCGEGFFCCYEGYCIPSFLLNNGEHDCPHGEDEGIPVHNTTCPGFYRCQGTGSCVHKNYVCDGIYHCPNKDDEMFCQDTCPTDLGCVCEGQAYVCSRMIDPRQHLHVRYLDLSHAVDVSLEHVHFMEYLFFLNLSFCQLSNVTLSDMPHLQVLDLSFNSLRKLDNIHLRQLTALRYLDLSSNPFVKVFSDVFHSMLQLSNFLNLRTLNMLNVSLEAIEDKMFMSLPKLKYLNIRNNPVHKRGKNSLWGLKELEVLHTDDSRLCCKYFHPSLSRCHAPIDELSSCSDLLAQDFFRVCLWSISLLALTGNVGVLIYRLFINTHSSSPSFQVLVINLSASDLLMGVYTMMIGVTDARFRGVYVEKEYEWTDSVECTIAGLLSFVSSEVSAFVLCLITLDRVLVICFPFNSCVHLSRRVAVSVCCVIWVIGVALAVTPILTGMEFYGLNGICLPLPITRRQHSGQIYAFSIFIVLNFILCILIAVGQVCIYRAIHRHNTAHSIQRREQDMAITRRLFLVAFTDFCCWFPIGLMGLLAYSEVPISGQVNVWAAIFVLPINSALNPFLYTLNILTEQCKKPERGSPCSWSTAVRIRPPVSTNRPEGDDACVNQETSVRG